MIENRWILLSIAFVGSAFFAGCATQVPPKDYSEFQKAKPATLLVMPPINDSPEVKASAAVWSHTTLPLSEAGYYVLPVTLVNETFKQNGVNSPNDAAEIPFAKLREFFGADAAVYITIKRYGTTYSVITSETLVEITGKIVDLRTGMKLWEGKAQASSAEQQQQNQGGIVGMLVAAVVKQIIGSVTDAGYSYAGVASQRMLGAPQYNGVLPGPRSRFAGEVVPPK